MNLLNRNKIDFSTIERVLDKPALFDFTEHKFWDDNHIASQMLQFHLNPDIEAASKSHETIDAECDFIISSVKMNEDSSVLDLGCGPGLYIDRFAKTGAGLMGVDLSPFSIDYAKKTIQTDNKKVKFVNKNYLNLNFKGEFDIATLIFYDFCSMNKDNQEKLLKNVNQALKPGGFFVFDIVTDYHKTDLSPEIVYERKGGFWSADPYLLIRKSYLYDKPKAEGFQFNIINEKGELKIIRVFHRLFSISEIKDLMNEFGFEIVNIYKNLKGESLEDQSSTSAIIARKERDL